ncbi:ENTH domain-containing protein 1 isoform X1 [Heterocephalus glaber]|uniref:ENTH domain-containing protein 1 isoform X1 n=1 Tax=Heterocephalus glaber TaxID=10181 RepID=A0AAX6T1W8_HETGA|nr:ENTH domain-containing protein 1 isoform X1 [Heterocephalus glaber]
MAFRRQVKNFVKNYSDAEIKVREATSNDPWGPSSSLMLDISDLTFNTISLSEIMNMLWQRLSDHGKNWRHVYKSLSLMDYLIKNGSKKVIQHCREGFFNLQMLKDFQHIDEAGKDQGYYIREKSKQVITLLMDEQLLYKEREVACRTRWRTSYSMTFSKRLPDTENASKARLKQEQYQELKLPAETMLSQETLLPLEGNAWKSTDDLILFYDEDPKPSLPMIPSSVISPTTCLSDGEVEVSIPCDADAMPTYSEKCPSLQINVTLDKESENAISNTVIENPLQTPQGKQETIKSVEMLTVLPAFCSSSKEEFISPNLRISKSDSAFYNQSSVETLCVSPSFKTVNPVKETVISKDLQKPTQASIVQMDNEDLKTLTTWVSPTSEGTSSFSATYVSPPDAAPPEKPVLHLALDLPRPFLWALPHPQWSSASIKHRDKTASVHLPFTPRSLVSSDEEENDNASMLEILPANSESAKNKTSHIFSSNWVAFPTQNVDNIPSMSCSSLQPTKGNLPREPEPNSSIKVLLGEVKSAIVRLHEDLSTVIKELNVINSHLVSMSGNSLQVSKSM